MAPNTTNIHGSHVSQGLGYNYGSGNSGVSDDDYLKKKLYETSIHDAANDPKVKAAVINIGTSVFAFNS